VRHYFFLSYPDCDEKSLPLFGRNLILTLLISVSVVILNLSSTCQINRLYQLPFRVDMFSHFALGFQGTKLETKLNKK
jgi:hypothetical protein